MRHKKITQVIALILAILMVIGMIPSVLSLF